MFQVLLLFQEVFVVFIFEMFLGGDNVLDCVTLPREMQASMYSPQIGHRLQTQESIPSEQNLVIQSIHCGYFIGQHGLTEAATLELPAQPGGRSTSLLSPATISCLYNAERSL